MQMIKNNQKNMYNTEMRLVAFCKRVKIKKIKKRAKISRKPQKYWGFDCINTVVLIWSR